MERPEDIKRAIIDAAIKSYAEKGVAATTITDIAKAIGTSASQIAYHFGSIKNVYPSVVAVVAESARAYVNEYVDRRSKQITALEAYIEGTFRWGSEHTHLRNIWSYVIYTGTFQEKTRLLVQQAFQIAQSRIETSLYEHSARRKLSSANDSDLVRQIHALLVGNMIHQGISKIEPQWKKQSEEFIQTMNLLINARSVG